MIIRRTLAASALLCLTLTLTSACDGRVAPPGDGDGDDDGDDDGNGFVPDGPPSLAFLVDAEPEDDSEGFVEVGAGERVRYGDPFTVVARNFAAGARVTFESELYGMASSATFVVPADTSDGSIDLRRDAPAEGTASSYEGVDAEGLLWSMDGPGSFGALDLTVTVRAVVDGEEVVSASLARRFINEGIVTQTVADGTTRGVLAMPEGDGPFTAVLVFGGSEGGTGTGEFQSMYLASLGYAALGVGYFGAEGLPADLEEVPLEILEQDLAFLAADARVDAARIVVMGGSRGGELSLLLAQHFPGAVAGVVGLVPSGLVWGALTTPDRSAWSLAGAPVPFMPSSSTAVDVDVDLDGIEHVRFRRAFLEDIEAAPPAALDAATIRVENVSGPVLLLSGDDDQLWPSCVLADIAFARLQSALGRDSARDENHCFADAGHGAVGVPGWSTMQSREFFDERFDAFLVLGGTPQGNARANREADTAIRRFLRRL